ncbi:hypothetical protein MnTg04_01248 [bacterium MnTg04]|nr:hypothetical protein MnTg04_01248 [bacterium MnTg04]
MAMPAIGRDDIGRSQAIDHQAVFTADPGKTTAEGQTGDSGMRDSPSHRCQPVLLGLHVELAAKHTRLDPGDTIFGVYLYPFHAGQIDHQAAITRGFAGKAVCAALDRDQ